MSPQTLAGTRLRTSPVAYQTLYSRPVHSGVRKLIQHHLAIMDPRSGQRTHHRLRDNGCSQGSQPAIPARTVHHMTCASIMRLTKTPSTQLCHPRLLSCTTDACRSGRRSPMHTCTCTSCVLVRRLCKLSPPWMLLTVSSTANGPISDFLTVFSFLNSILSVRCSRRLFRYIGDAVHCAIRCSGGAAPGANPAARPTPRPRLLEACHLSHVRAQFRLAVRHRRTRQRLTNMFMTREQQLYVPCTLG